jgi:hypothetical protein
MKRKTNLRFISKAKRVESKCYICEQIGPHKWLDSELGSNICNGCVNDAITSEKMLKESFSQEHPR